MHGEVDVNCSSRNRSLYVRLMLRKISRNICVGVLVSTVHANFFGRPMYTGSLDANAIIVQPNARGVFMPMIRRNCGSYENRKRAPAVSAASDEKPHVEIPIRRNSKETDLIDGGGINNYEVSTDATIKVALHSSSVVLALCGDSADVILDHIMSFQSPKKRLIDRCLDIRPQLPHIILSCQE
jgi:hypothetical protein